MFLSERELLVHRERYKDLLREAERVRLVRQMQAGREGRERFHRSALTWLGGRLVAWGWGLQERYGAATAAPVLQAADRLR